MGDFRSQGESIPLILYNIFVYLIFSFNTQTDRTQNDTGIMNGW